jgi:regulator of protease activity HflC (stomatin/prohibitin superfamily)
MLGYKRIVIAQHERGIYLENRSIQKILEPGVYRIFDPLGRIWIEVHDLSVAELVYPYIDVLIKEQSDLCERYFQIVELGKYEVGLVYKNGQLNGVLAPASRQLYWKGPIDIKVEVLNIAEDYAVPRDKVGIIAHARADGLSREVLNAIVFGEIPDNHVGLLIVDGELVKSLQPGLYAFWKYNRRITIEQADLRVQSMDVSGQEILTKDKVTLRVNLTAQYKTIDVVKARSELVKFGDYLYGELQFALRQAVSASTLDILLGDKGSLDQTIYQAVRQKVEGYGIEVRGVGVKDIILPGDMKDILNQVVQTEKAAQANVIKRREETAATRSLLNTARLMDDNPTLMRLKELEVLEKVTEKVDKLTVFGGLDGVLNDTVRINVRPD